MDKVRIRDWKHKFAEVFSVKIHVDEEPNLSPLSFQILALV